MAGNRWRLLLATSCCSALAAEEFSVSLQTAWKPNGAPGGQAFSYPDDGYSGPTDWMAQFGGKSLAKYKYWGGPTFKYLQTVQFVLDQGDAPTILTVQDSNADSGASCAAALFENRTFWFPLGAGAGLDLKKLPAPSADAPLHLTIVPSAYNLPDCQPAGPAESQRALSVWISVAQTAGAQASPEMCHFTVGGDPLGNGCLNPPYWQFVPAEGSLPAYMVFKGSLVDAILRAKQNKTTLPPIRIDAGVDLGDMPVNAMLVRLTVVKGSEQGCMKYDFDNCTVTGVESLTLDAEQPLLVSGYGRINGYQQLQNNRMANPSLQWQWLQYCGNPTARSLSSIKFAAQYHLYSGLLVLSSSVKGSNGFAVDMSGISVGFGPTRNQGAVQLNSAYCPAVKTLNGPVDSALNAQPTRMFDVKIVGNWIGASDGPEVMGPGSVQSYMYLHVNDDSIKVGAPRMNLKKFTILQGNIGAVIDIGCYGLNRGTSGTRISGVFVHRITHNTLTGGKPGYDGFNGIVATRTCPRWQFPGGDQQPGLVDVIVSDLSVPGLGWVGSAGDGDNFGPNSVAAPFAVSVNPAGSCNWGGGGLADKFLVSGLRFENWTIMLRPAYPSIIANYPVEGTAVTWGGPDGRPSVWAGEVDSSGPVAGSTVFYPEGDLAKPGFYVCGTGSTPGTSEPGCFNTCSPGAPGCEQTASNVEVTDPSGTVAPTLRFPFTKSVSLMQMPLSV